MVKNKSIYRPGSLLCGVLCSLLSACQSPTGSVGFQYDGSHSSSSGSTANQSQHNVSWSFPTAPTPNPTAEPTPTPASQN